MKEFWKNIKLTWKYTKDQKTTLIKYIIVTILNIIVALLIPILSAQLIVKLTNNQLYQLIFIGLIIYLVENIYNIISYLSTRYYQIIRRESYTRIQKDLGSNILNLEVETLDKNSSGVFIQRLTRDTEELSIIFNEIIYELDNLITNISIFLAIFIINKIVFIYLIFMILVLYLIEKRKLKKLNVKDKEFREKNERTTGFIGELVRGVRDIKMLNSEDSFMNALEANIKDTNKTRHELQSIYRVYFYISSNIKDLMYCMLLILFILLIKSNKLSGANALIIYNFSERVLSVLYSISSIQKRIKSFNLSCKRIYEVIDSDKFKKENFGTTHLPHINGDFEFKNVHFSYGKEKVLKGINFKVNANETVAFVGKSGAGKTTIFNLLCKMYESQKGTITIDGKNIKKLDKDTIRGNITIISQNPYIFNMTIRENLTLVKENLTEDEMFEACKLACLHDYIMTLPDKYDTVIGEGGVNLSGGQKQRLAIARAFIQKTEIILFDEATSALDNETQAQIQKAIENMQKDYTILIIAHRLSTIINADRILYIEDGIVKSEGTHKELLKNCEGYKRLYTNEIKNRE